jgi:hypothetical protein
MNRHVRLIICSELAAFIALTAAIAMFRGGTEQRHDALSGFLRW